MLRLSLLFLIIYSDILAVSVLITKQSIKFEQKIEPSMLKIVNIKNIRKKCLPLKLSQIQNEEYISAHYINKGVIVCNKDVKKYKKNSVIFNFGGFEIEKKGRIIYENEDFIRIKKENGKFEKIYKDGRLK